MTQQDQRTTNASSRQCNKALKRNKKKRYDSIVERKPCYYLANPHLPAKCTTVTPVPLCNLKLRGSLCCQPKVAFGENIFVVSCDEDNNYFIQVFSFMYKGDIYDGNNSFDGNAIIPSETSANLTSMFPKDLIMDIISLETLEIIDRRIVFILTSTGTLLLLQCTSTFDYNESMRVDGDVDTKGRYTFMVLTSFQTGEVGSNAFVIASTFCNDGRAKIEICCGHNNGLLTSHILTLFIRTQGGKDYLKCSSELQLRGLFHSRGPITHLEPVLQSDKDDSSKVVFVAVGSSTFLSNTTTLSNLDILNVTAASKKWRNYRKIENDVFLLDSFCVWPDTTFDLVNGKRKENEITSMSFDKNLGIAISLSNGLIMIPQYDKQKFNAEGVYRWGILDKRHQFLLPECIINTSTLCLDDSTKLACCGNSGDVYLLPLYDGFADEQNCPLLQKKLERIIIHLSPFMSCESNSVYRFSSGTIKLISSGLQTIPVFIFNQSPCSLNVFTSRVFDRESQYIEACIGNETVSNLLDFLKSESFDSPHGKISRNIWKCAKLECAEKHFNKAYIEKALKSNDDQTKSLRRLLYALRS